MSTNLINKQRKNNVNHTEFHYQKNYIDLNINTTATSNFSLTKLNNSEINIVNKKNELITKKLHQNSKLKKYSDNTINSYYYSLNNNNPINIENNNYNDNSISPKKTYNSYICYQNTQTPIEPNRKKIFYGNFIKNKNNSFLIKNKSTTNLRKNIHYRTDRNGTEINKLNKKKIKVTFIDEIENKPLVQTINIQNQILGIHNVKEIHKKQHVTCCTCIIF